MNIIYAITSVFIISLASFAGVFTLKFAVGKLRQFLIYFLSFSAGSMLGGAFLHMLPEVIEEYGFSFKIPVFILSGILFSFILEKLILWRHCHMPIEGNHVHSFGIMNLVGDAMHNFIDGIIIGVSFLLSIPSGIATSIAVLFHEIPQEISDFGVLVHSGFSIKKALLLNFLIACTSFLGLALVFLIGLRAENLVFYAIPFAMGNFIYIANTDLIPELHKECSLHKSLFQVFAFVLGIALMAGLKLIG